MNELSGRFVNVVLVIEEGKGMEFLKHPLTIEVDFNERLMETDPAEPEECPAFNTELVWEIEKKELRKLRTMNCILRLECHTVKEGMKQERIGFVLLSIRCAPVVSKKSNKDIPFKWQKLIGLSNEYRPYHPELHLSLTIRDSIDKTEADIEEILSPFIAADVENEDLQSAKVIENLRHIPLSYLENGYIQVGEASEARQSFLLNLIIKAASNLDVLLPEVLVFSQSKEKYHISFNLFGICLKSKPLLKDLQDSIILNEKIVVSLLSSFETLKEFFAQHHQIVVHFHSGCDKLGMTKINVEKLMCDTNEVEFKKAHNSSISKEEKCYFKFPSPNGIVPQGLNGRKPFVEVKTLLQQIEKGYKPPAEPSKPTNTQKKTIISSVEKKNLKGAGDHSIAGTIPEIEMAKTTEKKSQSSHEFIPKKDVPQVTKSDGGFLKDTPYVQPEVVNCEDEAPPNISDEQFKHYCLKVDIIESEGVQEGLIVEFRHPKGDSLVKKDIKGNLKDACCQLHLSSTSSDIASILHYHQIHLVIKDNSDNILDHFRVDTSGLYTSDSTKFTTSIDVKNTSAKLKFSIQLTDCGAEDIQNINENDLLPPIFDDRILAKHIKEFQEWKDGEKTKFCTHLKIQEKKHLKTLHAQWTKKKTDLESKLNKSVSKCKILTQELKLAANNLRIRNALENKLASWSKGEYRFEEEMEKNISKYSQYEFKQLVEKICKLEEENNDLREIVEEQNDEIEATKKSALTKEQTANLLKELRVLEEQFEDAQKQKSYFKEQWKKAVQEIHALKTEDQKQILCKIQMEREELSQISLNGFFDYEEEKSDPCDDDSDQGV